MTVKDIDFTNVICVFYNEAKCGYVVNEFDHLLLEKIISND